jgi:hypothetical protein
VEDDVARFDAQTIVEEYERAIRTLLSDASDRRRFQKIRFFCKQADELLRTAAEDRSNRAGDFDGDAREDSPEGDGAFGVPARLPAFGETGEVMRSLLACTEPLLRQQQRRLEAEADREGAAAILELLEARSRLLAQGMDVEDVDARITEVRKEIGHGLVHTIVLRGHKAHQDGRRADNHIVGEDDGGGAVGPEGTGEEVPEVGPAPDAGVDPEPRPAPGDAEVADLRPL